MKKFERWRHEEKENFVSSFANAYNREHSTTYSIINGSFIDEQDYDFRLRDGVGDILKIQHTFAGSEPLKEYVKPKNASKVIRKAEEGLQNVYGYWVYVNIFNPPTTKNQIDKTGYWLSAFIKNKIRNSSKTCIFSYSKNDDSFMQNLQPFINDLEIFHTNSVSRLYFAYGSNTIEDSANLGEDQRIEMAVDKKVEKNYANPSDLLLLVHFNISPVSSVYLPIMRNEQSDKPFKEIWVYDEWGQLFHRIK